MSSESVLSYDTTIYDAYSCKRDMIREKFKLKSYKDVYYFKLVDAKDNMAKNAEIQILSFVKLPEVFYEFLDAFHKYPHPYIHVYTANELQYYINAQNVAIMQRDKLQQLMYFIPIASFHHHVTKWDDSEYLHLLLFVNVVDKDINIEPQNSFIINKVPCNHILSQTEIQTYLTDLTNSTLGDDLSKLRSIEFQPLHLCLQQLVKSSDLF